MKPCLHMQVFKNARTGLRLLALKIYHRVSHASCIYICRAWQDFLFWLHAEIKLPSTEGGCYAHSVPLGRGAVLWREHNFQFARAWDDEVCCPVLVSKGVPAPAMHTPCLSKLCVC